MNYEDEEYIHADPINPGRGLVIAAPIGIAFWMIVYYCFK